jgi:streptogramin lyase
VIQTSGAPRRIVQVALTPFNGGIAPILFAVADDGTLWIMRDPTSAMETARWEPMAKLP